MLKQDFMFHISKAFLCPPFQFVSKMLIKLNYYISDFQIANVFKPVSALHLHSHLIHKYYHRKYFVHKALKNTSQRRIACVVYIRQTNKIPWKNTHCKHQCLPIEDSCCNTIQGACCQDFPHECIFF